MKSLYKILNLTIVREYYRQNAVFIFTILMFSFGFLRAIEHINIIKNALILPSLLSLVFIVWLLHGLKVILFTLRLLESKPNEFLYQARLFSPIKRFTAFGLVQFNLIQLTFLYSLWMIKIGIEENHWNAVVAIIASNVVLILLGIIAFEYRLYRPNAQRIISKPIQTLFSKFQTPSYLFFVRFLFAKQPVLLLITKLCTCFVLVGVCNLYSTDAYDERLLALGGLFASAGHTVFCQQYIYFENKYLSLIKNLPFTPTQRLLQYLSSYTLLLIPEMIVLIRNLPEEISYIFALQLIIFILSLIFLNHHAQYIRNISPDSFMQRLFFIGILFLVLIMFKIPVILMALVNFLSALFVFKKHYNLAELNQ